MTENEFCTRKWKNGEIFYTVAFRFFRGCIAIPYGVIRVKTRIDTNPRGSRYINLECCNRKYWEYSVFQYCNWIYVSKNTEIRLTLSSYKDTFKPNEYLFKTKEEALEKLESDRQYFLKNGISEVKATSEYVIREAKKDIKDARSVFRMKIFQMSK